MESKITQQSAQQSEIIIEKTIAYVKETMKHGDSGHAFDHIQRVHNLAKKIYEEEITIQNQQQSQQSELTVEKKEQKIIDLLVIELGALLHDIADWKFTNGCEETGPNLATKFLTSINVEQKVIDHVVDIIRNISYKGANVENKITTIEGKIVQDADRIDAIGAIGIARCFSYGGFRQRPMYDPDQKPVLHQTAEQYKNNNSSSINHFYEKLLLIKDKLNTESGKKIADNRHKFMEQFLDQFFKEWESKV